MKRLVLLFILTIALGINCLKAQWTLTGSNIYNSNTGNVGIGTTSPTQKLEVVGNIRMNSFTTIAGNPIMWNNDLVTRLGFNVLSPTIASIYYYNQSSALYQTLSLGNYDPTKSINVVASGNVGIGILTPSYKLDVIGDVNISAGKFFRIGGVPIISSQWLTGSGNISYSTGNVGIGTTAPSFPLHVRKDQAGYTYIASDNVGSVGSGSGSGFAVTEGGAIAWALRGERDGTGKFNIARNGTTNVMTFDAAGNVGIGTTTPNAKLHVFASGAGKAQIWGNSNTSNTVIYDYNTSPDSPSILFGDGTGWKFHIGKSSDNGNTKFLTIQDNGNVGIGTTNLSTYKLAVNGTIGAKEVTVTADGWADFVFYPTYKLRTLGEVEQFIKTNNHLPEIPTAKEVKENGVGLGEMNAKLLQKVEELTLYMIEQQKLNDIQTQHIKELEMKIEKLITK